MGQAGLGMSYLRFGGMTLGIMTQAETASGDRNDASNYSLVCHCGTDTGPLSRWTVVDGYRMVCCLQCKDMTIVHHDQIHKVVPAAEVERLSLSRRPILNPRKSWQSGETVNLCRSCVRIARHVFELDDQLISLTATPCGGCKKQPENENDVFRRYRLHARPERVVA